MKILVTGVTGFVGRALARRLQADGHEVIGVTRDTNKARRELPEVQQFYRFTPDGELSPSVLEQADGVVHLAGESVAGRWTKDKKNRIFESRITGTRNLVNAMRSADYSGFLVSASAVGFYGDRGDEELTEESIPGEGFLACVCEAWEAEAMQAAEAGIRTAVMRFGIVLGNGGGAMKPMLPLFRLGMGGPLGDGKQWWPWVHIDDVVSALAAVVEQPYEGIFNLTAPQPVRQKQFARALGSAIRRPAFLPAPGLALRLAQGEFADEVLFSKRVLPARLEAEGFRFAHPGLEGALSDLLSGRGEHADLLASA